MSNYLQAQLPNEMARDANLQAFLRAFDEFASALYDRVGSHENSFDTTIAPMAMVRWMAERFGVGMVDAPDERQRLVTLAAACGFNYRGTAAALQANLSAAIGAPVEVSDPTGGFDIVATPATRLTTVGEGAAKQQWDGDVSAALALPPPTKHRPVQIKLRSFGLLSAEQIVAEVERDMPAHVSYEIVRPAPPAKESS